MENMIIRGSNPTVELTYSDQSVDLRTFGSALVTIRQGVNRIEVNGNVSEHAVTFSMTQEQTLSLKDGEAMLQINFKSNAGVRTPTFYVRFAVYGNLHDGVI